jgi:hypothetical protein
MIGQQLPRPKDRSLAGGAVQIRDHPFEEIQVRRLHLNRHGDCATTLKLSALGVKKPSGGNFSWGGVCDGLTTLTAISPMRWRRCEARTGVAIRLRPVSAVGRRDRSIAATLAGPTLIRRLEMKQCPSSSPIAPMAVQIQQRAPLHQQPQSAANGGNFSIAGSVFAEHPTRNLAAFEDLARRGLKDPERRALHPP